MDVMEKTHRNPSRHRIEEHDINYKLMRYPTWQELRTKYSEDPQGAFESLCRLLFRNRYGIGESLPYYYNNAGDETSPIQDGNDVVGFQAKFLTGETIGDSGEGLIKHSIETAHSHYPDQNKMIVYVNVPFGNPPKGKTITDRQKRLEDTANNNSLVLEWVFGDSILDAVVKNELLYNLFFNLEVDLIHLDDCIKNANQYYIKSIKDSIICGGKDLTIGRENIRGQLEGFLSKGENVVLQGESGSGKSAVMKDYSAKHSDATFLWLNGGQFNTDDVNALFHFEKSFTLEQIRQYYKDIKNKIVVIDSAERLLDTKNKTPLMLFIGGMQQDEWQFVFTVRNAGSEGLLRLLRESLVISAEIIDVPLITNDVLNGFLKENGIVLPTNPKLYDRIHNLFYLARYTEVAGENNITLNDFQNNVWNVKMRGQGQYNFVQQELREQCLLEMGRRKLHSENFYINKEGLNIDAIGGLVQDDIVCSDGRRGYYFAHDIYQEWAIDYQVDSIWEEQQDVKMFLSVLGGSLLSVNTFKRWFGRQIENNEKHITLFVNTMFQGSLDETWQEAIITAILRSHSYSKTFYELYNDTLIANDYYWAKIVLKLLPVNCQDILTFILIKGAQYPIMRPVGSGWDCSIDFIFAHRQQLVSKMGRLINKILLEYHKIKDGNKVSLHKAGLLALKPHIDAANIKKTGQFTYFENEENACLLTASYFLYIHEEIRQILEEVIKNKWVRHTDPYWELTTYIVKAENDNGLPLYYWHPNEVLNLMDLYWREQDVDRDDDSWSYGGRFHDVEKYWGLSDERLMLKYFPASGLQTCIGRILLIHPKLTIGFIIKFVDKCVKEYAKNHMQFDAVAVLELKLPDGTTVKKKGNQTIWNLYRGTSGISVPDVLVSIHMALESFFLQVSKDGKVDEVKDYLWEIIRHSESLSLMAIVASVVVAYPDEFFDEAILMTSNLQFLKYDLTRYSSEINAGMLEFSFHRHPNMLIERKNSNALKHRKQHLETLLFNIQATLINSKDEVEQRQLQRAFDNVDCLKEQLENEPEEEKLLTKFIISRCDVRNMQAEKVVFKWMEGVVYTPNLDEEQKQMHKQSMQNSNNMLVSSMLRMWANYRGKREYDKIRENEYEKDPLKALAVCKDIIKQLELKKGGLFLLPGDEYVPSAVCAVLIRDFPERLPKEEYDFCIDVVVNALEDIDNMTDSSLSTYDICIQAIGNIIDSRPNYSERCFNILYSYSKVKQEVAGRRCCDVLADAIMKQELWIKHETEMGLMIDKFIKEQSKSGIVESLDYDDAEALLCLFSVYPSSEKMCYIANVSLERVSHMWDLNDERTNLFSGSRYACSDIVAKIILSANKSDISRILEYFTRYLNTNKHDTFLMSFIMSTILSGDYERFWIAWYALYDTIIIQRDNLFYDDMLNNYMLNPVQYTNWGDNWFRIDEKDMAFFKRIAIDAGHVPYVLSNIVRVSRTLAKNYFRETLEIIESIAVAHPALDLEEMNQDTMLNIEAILKRELPKMNNELRVNRNLRQQLVHVLDFMIERGSSYASTIKTGLN